MLLAVDIGNTNIVLGIHDGESWRNHWRICTDPAKMPDEYGVLVRDLLREEGIHRHDIRQSVISSVVPGLTGKIREMIQKMCSFQASSSVPESKPG